RACRARSRRRFGRTRPGRAGPRSHVAPVHAAPTPLRRWRPRRRRRPGARRPDPRFVAVRGAGPVAPKRRWRDASRGRRRRPRDGDSQMLARDARALDVVEERGPAPAAGYADVLSPDECARVRELAAAQESAPARVGLAAVEDSDVRRAAVRELELGADTAWIYDRIASYVELANATVFRFDLVGFEGALQYVEYGP